MWIRLLALFLLAIDLAGRYDSGGYTKAGKAKSEMYTLLGAVKKYYAEHEAWPDCDNLEKTIGPMIEGNQSLVDPWGGKYKLHFVIQEKDGSVTEYRPVISCYPPNQPPIHCPEKMK